MTSSDPAFLSGSARNRRRRVVSGVAVLIAGILVVMIVGSANSQRATALTGSVGALDGPAVALAPAQRGDRVHRPFADPPAGKLIFPVDAASNCSLLWSSFGASRSGGARAHEGTDIMGSAGREVYAVANGTLTQRYSNTGSAGYGWTLVDSETGTRYRYFHLTDDPADRALGEQVVVGDVIGYVGDTGTTVGNFHLHFEVRPNNTPVNPMTVLDIPKPPCQVGS